jgi:histidinol-phosphate aminotransferase
MKYNSILESIKSYEAGKPIELVVREYGIASSDIIKLASNENPNGASPMVIRKIQDVAASASIYPDDSFFELKSSLAKFYDVNSENMIIGAGSDQILEFVSHALLNENETVLMNNITFAMYEIYAKGTGANIVKTSSVHHDLEEFYKLYIEHKPKLIFICTPNNPTGDAIKYDDLFRFLDKIDKETFVVVDAAYMEYAKAKDDAFHVTPKMLMDRYENVLYTGTFSKAYGLGGMRVGYGVGPADMIKVLHKLRPPFNITTLSLAAAIEALKDQSFVADCIATNYEQMAQYEKFALEIGLETIPSYTNFITLMLKEHKASDVVQTLLEQGIIIRDISGYGINAIRITIGKAAQNQKVLAALRAVLV